MKASGGGDDRLRIAELPTGDGTIGVTFCPGKQGPGVHGVVWQRSLEADLAVIRDWRASALVTLIEPHEFELLHVEALPAAVQAAGIEWHHLPIEDVSVPGADFLRRWRYAGLQIRRRLRSGERVLVHCRGGLGRAGLVAASLLVELGEAGPREAIAMVRTARPGAIETTPQEKWIAGRRPVTPATDLRASSELGCLLGGAIGDALGYRVEFDTLEAIRVRHGPQGIRLAGQSGPLVISDDTQMTLFTLEAMSRAEGTDTLVDEIREAYLDWLGTQHRRTRSRIARGRLARHPALQHARAPGTTCLSALRAGGQGTVERPANDSKGCGGVMRTAPLGFLAGERSSRQVYELGAAAAAITHGHADGWAPAGVMAQVVHAVLENSDWDAAIDRGLETLRDYPDARGTARLLQAARRQVLDGGVVTDLSLLGRGWVGDEALAMGLAAAATAADYDTAIEVAANHDGDSDSTAAIAGQLFGARHGIGTIPAQAVYRLDALDALLDAWGEWAESRGRRKAWTSV
jgi:ADP-ribosyl-[dinitrogen reductase] hydrolase